MSGRADRAGSYAGTQVQGDGPHADARQVRRFVLAASLFLGALAAAWSVVLPPGEGPDEPAHLGLVLHLADGNGYPDHDELQMTVGLERLCTTFVASVRVCPLPGEEVTATAVRVRGADDAPGAADRPAWDDDGGALPTTDLNQMPQHPPLYYASMAGVLSAARAVAGGEMALDRELALLRLANAAMVVPIPVLTWLTVRRLTLLRSGGRRGGGAIGPRGSATTASTAVLHDVDVDVNAGGRDVTLIGRAGAAVLVAVALPMLAATSGVLNNDNLLTLLAAATAPLLASIAVGDRSRGTLAAAGALIGLALLTKAFAVVLLPALAAACWVGSSARSTPGSAGRFGSPAARIRESVVPLLVGVGVAAAVSGWWYVRTWARAGSPTPSVDADRYTEALRPPGFAPDLWHFADAFAGRFSERFWGSFGWYSARLPGPLTVMLTIVAVALLVAGLASARRRGPIVVLLVPSLLLLVLTASRAWSLHARSGQYPFIQGRYLLGGVVGLAVVASVGWLRLVRFRRSLTLLAAVACLLQVAALLRAMTTYWSGDLVDALSAAGAWSGLPTPVAVGLVLTVPIWIVALVWTVAALDRDVPSASR